MRQHTDIVKLFACFSNFPMCRPSVFRLHLIQSNQGSVVRSQIWVRLRGFNSRGCKILAQTISSSTQPPPPFRQQGQASAICSMGQLSLSTSSSTISPGRFLWPDSHSENPVNFAKLGHASYDCHSEYPELGPRIYILHRTIPPSTWMVLLDNLYLWERYSPVR